MKYNFRCAQLDLARQKENIAFIREFIDLLAKAGYSHLMLYLEDRIKTPHYNYSSDEDSYSMDEMRSLVAYGAARGIELFPCIPTIGHAERFLRHSQLEPISEMRGGKVGRFGGTTPDTFCVSAKATTDFLFTYIREIADIFPSQWFHIGLDEFWNFALCDQCKAAAPDLAGEERLFLEHIRKYCSFLKTLNKRPIMWTDMLEIYQSVLPEIPREMVMAEWQYHDDVRALQAHFNNLAENSLKLYSDLGFDIIICPADRTLSGGESFLKMASTNPAVIGGLLTCWEKTDTYLYRSMPLFAAFGHHMCGEDSDAALIYGIRDIFGEQFADNKLFADALRFVYNNGACFLRHYESCNEELLFSRSIFGFPYIKSDALNMAQRILDNLTLPDNASSTALRVLADIKDGITEKKLSLQLKLIANDILDFGLNDDYSSTLQTLHAEYEAFYRKREMWWDNVRSGITPNFHTKNLPAILDKFQRNIAKLLSNTAFMRLRLMHSNWYGMNKMKITLTDKSGKDELIYNGIPKPYELDTTAVAEYFIPLPDNLDVASITHCRIDYSGFGGIGISYAVIINNGTILKCPATVEDTKNIVLNPENILYNDVRFAFLGFQDMVELFADRERAKMISSIVFSLKNM